VTTLTATKTSSGGWCRPRTAALRELKAKGILTQAWTPGRPGAMLLLDVADEAAAASLMAGFPLVQAGLISTEIVPLHPLDLG